MSIFAIVDPAGRVENVVEYDAQPPAPPPGFSDGYIAVPANGASPGWTYVGGALVAPVSAAPSQAILVARLVAGASAACADVVAQIYPDPAHQAAFQNAASIVNSNGGAAPSAAPLAAKFAALAAVYGLSATAFATLVAAMQGASFDLSAALATLTGAASAATTPAGLAAALDAFETALAATVAEINAAGLPSAIAAPAAISITGINA
jgi:hypothetical protein